MERTDLVCLRYNEQFRIGDAYGPVGIIGLCGWTMSLCSVVRKRPQPKPDHKQEL